MKHAALFEREFEARRTLNAGHNFLNPQLVEKFLCDFRAASGFEPQFLVSFPRSGNGYVRFLIAKIILSAAGYDVDRAKVDAYVHNQTNGNRAQRFNFPDRDEAVSVEAVIPDIHMNTPEAVAALGESEARLRSLIETVGCLHIIRRRGYPVTMNQLRTMYQDAEVLAAKIQAMRRSIQPGKPWVREDAVLYEAERSIFDEGRLTEDH